MSDAVDISWLRDRLMDVAGITDAQAGNLIGVGMAKGALSATAPIATCRPEESAQYHSEADYSEDTYELPQIFWLSVQVDWSEQRPYFRFFYQKRVWLVSAILVPRAKALSFIQANDPLQQQSKLAPEAVEARTVGTRGRGGAPAKVDWEKCLIEAARWMHVNGRPPSQADLVRHIAGWLGDATPGDTQLKQHLGPLYKAIEQADRSD